MRTRAHAFNVRAIPKDSRADSKATSQERCHGLCCSHCGSPMVAHADPIALSWEHGGLLRRLGVRIAVPSYAQATSQGVQCGSGPGATANAEVKGEVGNDHADMTTRAGSPGKTFGCCQLWQCLLSRWRPTESDVLNKLGISSCGQEVMCLMPAEGSPHETKLEIHHHPLAFVYCNWLHNVLEHYLQRCSAQYAITLSARGSEWPRIQYGEIAVWYIRSAVAWQSVNRHTRNIGSQLPMLQDVRRLFQACLPEFRMA